LIIRAQAAPGCLYHPSEFYHVFEKYWDYLPCLHQHPDFVKESSYAQVHMTRFSCGLSTHRVDDFEPKPAAEAKQSNLETAEDVAISRLRPIQDGPDLWLEHRSSVAAFSE
jgi:hypothetical protein